MYTHLKSQCPEKNESYGLLFEPGCFRKCLYVLCKTHLIYNKVVLLLVAFRWESKVGDGEVPSKEGTRKERLGDGGLAEEGFEGPYPDSTEEPGIEKGAHQNQGKGDGNIRTFSR